MLVPLESCGHTCSTHSALRPLFLFAALWQHNLHVAVVGLHITVLPRWVKLKWHHANPSGPVYRLPSANPLVVAGFPRFEIWNYFGYQKVRDKKKCYMYIHYIIIVNFIYCMIISYNDYIYIIYGQSWQLPHWNQECQYYKFVISTDYLVNGWRLWFCMAPLNSFVSPNIQSPSQSVNIKGVTKPNSKELCKTKHISVASVVQLTLWGI